MQRVDVRRLVEGMLDRRLPRLVGCRHVLITGATASGKTTMLRRIVDELDPSLCKRMITSSSELFDLSKRMASVGAMAPLHGGIEVEYVLRHEADVVIVDDVDRSTAQAVFEGMCADGPTIITIQTSDHPEEDDLIEMLSAADARRKRGPRVAVLSLIRRVKEQRLLTSAEPI
jgi:hypothetical protein